MKILAIETSCDETGAAVVAKRNGIVTVHSNVIATSLHLHAQTGGIIPEVAARNQIQYIIPVIAEALNTAGIAFSHNVPPDIDAIAVTYGPGLIGSLLVGVETIKTLGYLWNKPIIPINHLFGHIYANWIEQPAKNGMQNRLPEFPLIALIVSGGHTDLLLMKNHMEITWLGGTRDDAAGEAFDKIGRLLNLSYPAGPKIEQLAKEGNQKMFHFPRPLLHEGCFDFSFSGLKTAVLREVQKLAMQANPNSKFKEASLTKDSLSDQTVKDICRGVQDAITQTLVHKTKKAVEQFEVKSLLLSGGVAANQTLRDAFENLCSQQDLAFYAPEKKFCTDNAAMIGAAACFKTTYTPWKEITANPELYFD